MYKITIFPRGISQGYQGVSKGIKGYQLPVYMGLWGISPPARFPCVCVKNHVSRGIRSGEVRAFKILKGHRGFANLAEGAGRGGTGF